MAFDRIIIFTDGACSGNPGPGGWGAVLAFTDGKIYEMGGADRETTNNRMELMATIRSLEYIEQYTDSTDPISLYTDSVYVIRGITEWIWGWRKRGWKNAEGNDVANRELWERLAKAVAGKKIEWGYVRGHVGIPGNERVDEIAVAYTKGERPKLYSGKLLSYDVAIHDIPDDTSLPKPRKDATKKTKAFSYLSLVNGVVSRHTTWPECERAVKGRSGAKFKKALSADDEKKILASWGVSL
jgi:ribonuclease HI